MDISDVILLSRMVTEDTTANVTLQGKANAECDGNSGLNGQDVVMILRYIAQLISSFPV
ncbi:MAG: hypothetical protein MJ062_00800 [Oscillospiraceae bacterium]|nr:hypothetical protein [Oscillospiraceae bacterium]